MNRKVMKFLSVVLMVLMVVTMLSTAVFAANDASSSTWDNIDINQFSGMGDNSNAKGTFTQVVAAIINLVQVVGMGIAIIMLVVMAIKYISAAPSEKAELKKGITIYVVGAIVLFAAAGILQVIKNFATANIKADEVRSSMELLMATVKVYLG